MGENSLGSRYMRAHRNWRDSRGLSGGRAGPRPRSQVATLGSGGIVALVRVGRPLMSDRAEEDHAGDLAEQLQEGDHEADRAHHVQPRDQPHLYGGQASLLVPELLVAALRVQAATVAFTLHAAGVRHAVLFRPGLDLEPVRVIAHAATAKLKSTSADITQ